MTFYVPVEVADSESELSDTGNGDGNDTVEESSGGGDLVEPVVISVASLQLVLAFMLCGRGHTDCNRVLALLDLPGLTYHQWSKIQRVLDFYIKGLSQQSMDRALSKEIELAKAAGHCNYKLADRTLQGIMAASDGFWAK